MRVYTEENIKSFVRQAGLRLALDDLEVLQRMKIPVEEQQLALEALVVHDLPKIFNGSLQELFAEKYSSTLGDMFFSERVPLTEEQRGTLFGERLEDEHQVLTLVLKIMFRVVLGNCTPRELVDFTAPNIFVPHLQVKAHYEWEKMKNDALTMMLSPQGDPFEALMEALMGGLEGFPDQGPDALGRQRQQQNSGFSNPPRIRKY